VSGDRSLDRQELIELLTELGAELDSLGVRGELFIVGGAAMALAFDARRLTTDIDAVFEPTSTIREAAARVASRHRGIPADWVNDAMKGFLPGDDPAQRVILDIPGLRATVPSPEYLLAMKVQASRVDRDDDDIVFLADLLGLTTSTEILDVVERYFSRSRIEAKTQFFVEQLFPER
jgi:hypothetical protein